MFARFYRVLVVFGLLASTAAAQGPLALPAQVNGQLTGSSERVELTLAGNIRPADRYTFTLAAGQQATVRMESTAFDPYLKVLRNGTVFARNDDHDGSREISQLVLTSPGDYIVLAGSFTAVTNTGPYTLAVSLRGTPVSRPPAVLTHLGRDGGTSRGVLTQDAMDIPFVLAGVTFKADPYPVELRAGDVLTVVLESTAFDTYLSLSLGAANPIDLKTVAFNDDDGSTQRSRIRYRVLEGGLHTLYAGTISDEDRGRYTLTWRIE